MKHLLCIFNDGLLISTNQNSVGRQLRRVLSFDNVVRVAFDRGHARQFQNQRGIICRPIGGFLTNRIIIKVRRSPVRIILRS